MLVTVNRDVNRRRPQVHGHSRPSQLVADRQLTCPNVNNQYERYRSRMLQMELCPQWCLLAIFTRYLREWTRATRLIHFGSSGQVRPNWMGQSSDYIDQCQSNMPRTHNRYSPTEHTQTREQLAVIKVVHGISDKFLGWGIHYLYISTGTCPPLTSTNDWLC